MSIDRDATSSQTTNDPVAQFVSVEDGMHRPTSVNGKPRVVIVGGGFAGLSAATALAERGARVLVFEARPSLGGRAASFTDPATGEPVDNGQHVVVGAYVEMPLWLPAAAGGFAAVDVGKALAAGLTFRPLAETVRDTLAWASARPADYALRAGLSADREAELLAAVGGGSG